MNLRGFLSHNLALKLLALVLAFAAWVLAQGEQVHRVTVDVPVRYLFPDADEGATGSSRLVVMNDAPLPNQVRLQLSGTRVAISSFVADQGDLEYPVDLREAKAGTRVESFRIPPAELGPDIVLDTVSPAEVRIVLDDVDSVTVPVRIRRRGKLREGFREVRSRVNPDQVTLIGSRKDLANIETVDTVALRMGELDESGYLDPLALDLGGLHLLAESPTQVRVSVEVELKLEERQFDNIEIGLAAGMEAYRISPLRCRVKVQGPPQLVEELGVRDVRASLSGLPDSLGLAAGERAPVMALVGEDIEGDAPGVRVWIDHPRAAALRLVVEPQSFVVERLKASERSVPAQE
jgi:YbbR domain-containing protein